MREIDHIHVFEDRLFQRRILRWSLMVLLGGAALMLLWFLVICALNAVHGTQIRAFELGTLDAFPPWAVSFVIAVLAAFAVHELVHGLLFKRFAPSGAHVTYGINWRQGMAYACAEGVVYSREQYRAIIVAPSILVTVGLVAIGSGLRWPFWTFAAATIHLSGCTGDWGYLRELHLNPEIRWCEDTSWGVRFFGEDDGDLGDPEAGGAGRTDAERPGFIVVDGGSAADGAAGGASKEPAGE